uniref:Peptidase S1 domain-containing protein n=1 Tax=Monopterus albus TaxID=43700 RepID=A0A3Q3JQ17_MONAL
PLRLDLRLSFLINLIVRAGSGHEAVPHSRPYMALLECHTSNGEKKYCGGFLLNEDFVITAAHCQAKSVYYTSGLPTVNS